MKIKELAQQLEVEINIKIQELQKLGNEFKELDSKMNKINLEMINIYNELKPVEYVVRFHNPQLTDLFDSLVELANPKKKK